MNQEYLNKLVKEKNIILTKHTSFAKLESKDENYNTYLIFQRIKYGNKVGEFGFSYSPRIKEDDVLLTEEEFNKLTEMRYAVLQNSTQEICDWFANFTPIDNNFSESAMLKGCFKYLIYNPNSNMTFMSDIIDSDTILLSPEDFTKKFIKKENMKTITPEQAQSIIDIACSYWKEKLFKVWGQYIVYKKNIDIDEDYYKEMRQACTEEQHELFNKIFGKDIVIPKKGTLVYVALGNEWYMRFYSHYEKNNHYCFCKQLKEFEYTSTWNLISLTNPLIESPQYI